MTSRHGDRYDVHIGRNVSGQTVVGNNNTVSSYESADTVNLADLARFTQAVGEALPSLQLEADQKQTAQSLTIEILEGAAENQPDHNKLAALGKTLRTIIEGTGASVLSSALLGIWTP